MKLNCSRRHQELSSIHLVKLVYLTIDVALHRVWKYVNLGLLYLPECSLFNVEKCLYVE